MNDPTEKTTAALAIVEKRPQRPAGGCVGIFFKLFDWNRRFAKKKLFSKKLLPSVRAKQASKKFGGDEKLPKHRLIADENSGGFPNMKKNGGRDVGSGHRHEVRAPGLIARLMGLESMPAVYRDEARNASVSGSLSDRGFDKEVLNLEKGVTKQELRPQKLQKTGPLEKRPVTKFGVEAVQFKNILSRPRKHPPKLASPVKSPRSLSGRNASRLIGAATKILEPGSQARSRAKCALSYTNTLHHSAKDEATLEWAPAVSMDPSDNSSCYDSPAMSLTAQPSCRNCGRLVDAVDFRHNAEEQTSAVALSVSNDINLPPQGSVRSKPKTSISTLQQGSQKKVQQNEEYSATASDQAINNIKPSSEPISDRQPLYKCQMQSNSRSEPRKFAPSSSGFKQKTQGKNQVSLGWDGVPPQSKLSNLQRASVSIATNAISEPTDFVAFNQCLSGYTRSRMPVKVESCKFKVEREFSSPVRKRSINGNRQAKSSGPMRSTVREQKNVGSNAMTGKQMGCNAVPSMNQPCIRTRLPHLGENNQLSITGNELNDVISFKFSSPMKHKTRNPAQLDSRIGQNDATCTSTSRKSLVLDVNEKSKCLQKPLPLRVDFLGALLEEKLKELTCQEEELAIGRAPPKKTTAMILQELISALTSQRPFPPDNAALRCKQKNCLHNDGHMSKAKSLSALQAQPTTAKASVIFSHDRDHLSPGSVLEASFSNDSCFSSSVDDSFVPQHKPYDDFMDCSCDKPRRVVPEVDLSDSATSLNKGSSRELNDLISQIANVLCSLNLADTGLKASKLAYAIEVILAAELVFGSAAHPILDGNRGFSITLFLLDELETIASIILANFGCSLGAKDVKEGYKHRAFAFDCIIECLDSRCGRYLKAGPEAWTRLPSRKNAEMLSHEVFNEVRRWRDLAGSNIDELIEKEMSCALGKWSDFQIEAFETLAEIDAYILINLVDEIVRDVWDCRFGF